MSFCRICWPARIGNVWKDNHLLLLVYYWGQFNYEEKVRRRIDPKMALYSKFFGRYSWNIQYPLCMGQNLTSDPKTDFVWEETNGDSSHLLHDWFSQTSITIICSGEFVYYKRCTDVGTYHGLTLNLYKVTIRYHLSMTSLNYGEEVS